MQITIFSESYYVYLGPLRMIVFLDNTRTLEERRFFHVLILLFISFNGDGPSYIKDFFKLRTVNYNLRDPDTKLEQNSFNSK